MVALAAWLFLWQQQENKLLWLLAAHLLLRRPVCLYRRLYTVCLCVYVGCCCCEILHISILYPQQTESMLLPQFYLGLGLPKSSLNSSCCCKKDKQMSQDQGVNASCDMILNTLTPNNDIFILFMMYH